jgi:hypothetical protein
MRLIFDFEKDTPGTRRFRERVDANSDAVVGALYIKKLGGGRLARVEHLVVEIEELNGKEA